MMNEEKATATQVLILEDAELFNEAARMFAAAAEEAIRQRGIFAVALSGGSTPRRLYTLIAQRYADSIPWEKVHIFFGDERCVLPDHPDSNFGMAKDALLSKVNLPPENIHRMKGELEPSVGAVEYARELLKVLGPDPQLDLVFLGMGEEGHIASLFPGSQALHDTNLVAAPYVPSLRSHRLTLTPVVIRHARQVVPIVTGEKKAPALAEVLEGEYKPDLFPAQILRHCEGKVIWIVDPEAASLLKRCGKFAC